MKISTILRYLLLALGIAMLGIFLFTTNFSELYRGITSISLTSFAVIIGITMLNLALKAWRWQFLIKNSADSEIDFRTSFLSIIAGVAAGSLTPGRGGEIAKPLILKIKKGVEFAKSITIVIFERYMDLLALILVMFISMGFISEDLSKYSRILVAFSAVVVGAGIFFFVFTRHIKSLSRFLIIHFPIKNINKKRLANLHKSFFSVVKSLRRKRWLLFLGGISFLAMALEVVRLYYIISIFSINASFWFVMFVFAAALILGLLSMIPGGVGVTELSEAGIFAYFLGTQNLGLIQTAIIVDRFVAYYLLIAIGSLILVGYGVIKRNPKHLNTPEN